MMKKSTAVILTTSFFLSSLVGAAQDIYKKVQDSIKTISERCEYDKELPEIGIKVDTSGYEQSYDIAIDLDGDSKIDVAESGVMLLRYGDMKTIGLKIDRFVMLLEEDTLLVAYSNGDYSVFYGEAGNNKLGASVTYDNNNRVDSIIYRSNISMRNYAGRRMKETGPELEEKNYTKIIFMYDQNGRCNNINVMSMEEGEGNCLVIINQKTIEEMLRKVEEGDLEGLLEQEKPEEGIR